MTDRPANEHGPGSRMESTCDLKRKADVFAPPSGPRILQAQKILKLAPSADAAKPADHYAVRASLGPGGSRRIPRYSHDQSRGGYAHPQNHLKLPDKSDGLLVWAHLSLPEKDGTGPRAGVTSLFLDQSKPLIEMEKEVGKAGAPALLLDQIKPSTEKEIAQSWKLCKKTCHHCQRQHRQIPKSSFSYCCAKISLSVPGSPFITTKQVEVQTSLIPSDAYEFAILGWLLWSTYEHHQKTRDALFGRILDKTQDFIYLEFEQTSDHFIKIHNRTEFEEWWEGKYVKGRMGQRWMVITFEWNMGDVDMSKAWFGSYGNLFDLPVLDLAKAERSHPPFQTQIEAADDSSERKSLPSHSEVNIKNDETNEDAGERPRSAPTSKVQAIQSKGTYIPPHRRALHEIKLEPVYIHPHRRALLEGKPAAHPSQG